MARRGSGAGREARRLGALGWRLVGLGGFVLLLRWVLASTPLGSALGNLVSVALLMLVIGAALVALGHWAGRAQVPEARTPAGSPPSGMRAPRLITPVPPVLPMPPPASVKGSKAAQSTRPAPMAAPAPPGRPTHWSATVFELIEWRRFEAVVERLFQQAGFETKSQSHGADEGIDIWLYSRHAPGAPVSLVQCKHWQGKRVGVDKVRELRGVMAARQVTRGQFATTSTFTPEAQAFARDNGIHLLDIEGLLRLIDSRAPHEQQALLEVAVEGDYWRPTCVNCGVKMVERQPRQGGTPFWGCSQYPRCKTTMPMRAVHQRW